MTLNADFEKAFPPMGLQPQDRDVKRISSVKSCQKAGLETKYPGTEIYQSLIWIDVHPIPSASVKCHLNKADIPVAKKSLDNMCMKNMMTYVA